MTSNSETDTRITIDSILTIKQPIVLMAEDKTITGHEGDLLIFIKGQESPAYLAKPIKLKQKHMELKE